MPKKVIIALEDVEAHVKFIRKVNKPLLSSIVLTRKGKPIHIERKNVEEFMLTGLDNIDFITSRFYEKGRLRD